jgi:hypothetical protein
LFKENKPTSISWKNAFEAASNAKLLILQHLLLGINAHINLDLGIAVSQTVSNTNDLTSFKNDFNKINEILESMVDEVQQKIGEVSPTFFLLDLIGKGKEDKVVSFSINVARDGAWLFANQYHKAIDKDECVANRDELIGFLATNISEVKSRMLRWVIKSVRWLEQKNVAKVAQVLSS